MSTKETKKPHSNPKLMKALKHAVNFQNFLKKFIEQLVKTYPFEFETNIKKVISELKKITDEDMNQYKDKNQLKKSHTFQYVIKYLHNLIEVKEEIENKNIEVFNSENFPSDVFLDIPIDLYNIIQHEKITKDQKEVILVHINLLMKCSEEAAKLFELTSRQKKEQKVRKVYRNHMRDKMRDHIYSILGPDGRNSSMESIVEEILNELEKKRKAIQTGQMGPAQIKDMVMKLHKKFEKKHEQREITTEELYKSTKVLIKNLMGNKDLNMKEGFKDILSNMNIGGIPEDMLKNMMGEISNMDENTTPEQFEETLKKYAKDDFDMNEVLKNVPMDPEKFKEYVGEKQKEFENKNKT